MNLSYFLGKSIRFKKILFWIIVLCVALIFMILIKSEHKFLSPAARYIYEGTSISK